MRAVYHDARARLGRLGLHSGQGFANVLGTKPRGISVALTGFAMLGSRVVWASIPSPQDHMRALVPCRLDYTSHALTVDTHEAVRVQSTLHGVDCHAHGPIGTVLEANGETGTRSEFAMQLRFGRACTDSSPGDQVGDELRAGEDSATARELHSYCPGVADLMALDRSDHPTHLIVSNSSQPTGIPIELMSLSSSRASLRPLLILNDPSISGSLIRPFHPTVVRGFSLNGCQIGV